MTSKTPWINIELLNMNEDGWTIMEPPDECLQVAPKSLM